MSYSRLVEVRSFLLIVQDNNICFSLLPLIDVRRALLSLEFKVSKGEVRNMMLDADLGATNG